jgi:hypothetical protein
VRVRVAENSPNGAGRQPRAPGAQPINAGEMLAELVRLVDSSGLAPERPPPPVEPATQQELPDGEMAQPLEMELPRLSPSAPSTDPKETVVVAVEPPEPRKSSNSNSPNRIGSASRRGSGAWTLRISTLVLVGAVGSIVWLELMKSKPPEAPPVIAEAQSLPAVQPRSIATVAASSERCQSGRANKRSGRSRRARKSAAVSGRAVCRYWLGATDGPNRCNAVCGAGQYGGAGSSGAARGVSACGGPIS